MQFTPFYFLIINVIVKSILGSMRKMLLSKSLVTIIIKFRLSDSILVSFDWSMFENDGLTSIQYLESNRYAVVSSANQVPIEELENFLNSFSL